METNSYCYETTHFRITPFVSGSRRFHQVKRKSGKSYVQTFTDYEEARQYVNDMEEAFKLNEPNA